MGAVALQLIKFFSLLAIFAFFVIFLQFVVNQMLTSRAERATVNRRLKLLQSGMDREAAANLLRPDRVAIAQGKTGWMVRFYTLVGRSAVGIPPRDLLLMMVGATGVIFVLLLILAAGLGRAITPGTLLLLPTIAGAIGFGLPLFYLSRRAQKRSKKMEEQFPIGIDIFTRALRSGHPIASAIGLVTQEMPDPMGSEFGIVSDEISYGLDLNTSLANLARRWNLEDLRMFAVCISVQSETGGNLAEILGNLSSVIRDRASLYLKVRALSSEGRMSGWMLTIMPVLTFLALFAMNPGFYLDVAEDPLFIVGYVALLVMYAIGVMWIKNLVNLKV